MISLYIDTSSSYLYTALLEDGKVIACINEEYNQELSKVALTKIVEMIDSNKIEKNKIERLYVVVGPGSFTGIRIGVTIAKTWAYSLNKEIIEVSGLKAMALSYKGDKDFVMPLIDARRGFVYGALYNKNGDEVIMDTHILFNDLESMASKYDYDIISNNDFTFETISYTPDYEKIVSIYKDYPTTNPHFVNPCYLKRTEAEEKSNL